MGLPVVQVSKALLSRARRIRQDIHAHPELGFEEFRTAGVVAERLRALGLDDVQTEVAGTGVVGLLRGGKSGPTVALRADMDALPIQEETGLKFASKVPGVMHACGHDGHVAVQLGVAELLAGMRKNIAGNVKFIFQPAEEGGAGGKYMVEAGCLRDPDVGAICAFHCAARLKPCCVELSEHPYAGVRSFDMTVTGSGGHGAYPHACVDPVAAACQIVTAAQTIVSRELHPGQPGVVSFCAIHAGTKNNIIPDTVMLRGTTRAIEMKTLDKIWRALERVARNVAKAMRVKVEIQPAVVYPPLRCDPALVQLVRGVGEELVGKRKVSEMKEQAMGAEDFAFYMADQGGVPGVMFRLGVESKENGHTSRYDFGEQALETGILMMANVALRALAQIRS